MGDIGGLLKMFEEEKMFEQQGVCPVLLCFRCSSVIDGCSPRTWPVLSELFKKISEGKGEFTFRDMYEQFQNLLKLGP